MKTNKAAHKWSFLILLLVWVISKSFSQELKFKHLSIDEGLSSVNVKAIFQDSKDFIWIGTQDGLNRYDGYHITVFKSKLGDKKSLLSSDINCITEGEDEKLYIGTNGSGLSVFNRYTETFTNYTAEDANLSNNSITSLLHLNETDLLIGTRDGFCVFNKQTYKTTRITSPLTINDKVFVRSIFKDSEGTVWVAIPKYGIYIYDSKLKKLLLVPFPTSLNDPDYYKRAVMCFAEANHILYCGTAISGIIKYDLKAKKFENDKILFEHKNEKVNHIRDIKSSNKNILFLATLGGLVEYDVQKKTYQISTHDELNPKSINSDQLLCLLKDKQSNILIGSEDHGMSLNINTTKKFTHYNKYQLNGNDEVHCFLETNENILIGSENGLFSLSKIANQFNGKLKILKNSNVSSVYCLFKDNKNNIFIGTEDEGIILYNTKKSICKKILNTNYDNVYIHKIIKDTKGNIWAATYNHGLLKIDPEKFELISSYTLQDGLSSNIVNDVYEIDDQLWLSTSEGINILNIKNLNEKIKIYKSQLNKNSLSSNLIYSIYRDTTNVIWIATNNGLNTFKNGKFSVFTEEDGLPNNCIYTILPDKKGGLWLTTNNGLSYYHKKNKTQTGSYFINYNTNNGIQSKEFNQGAGYVCKDGKILVGGMNGFNYFDPSEIKQNEFQPTIYIASYSRHSKTVDVDTSILFKRHLLLNPHENSFTFEIMSLDYSAPDKIIYSYKLDGKDQDWSEPSPMRYITYDELSGGEYTLLIKSTNADGIWNPKLFKVYITVVPPWYKSSWFFIFLSILIPSIVFSLIWYRTNNIKKENKRLEQKVKERTVEIAQKNRDITSSIEYAKRIQEAILPEKELIFENIKNTFILYIPKDIVSGDFYWYGEKNIYKIIAVVDCTGHGVPGAFMSMIGHNLLNQIVLEKNNFDPGIILQELHKGVQSALKQGHAHIHTNDGMDVSILALNTETHECLWAGAFRSLVIINSEGKLEKIEGNKYSIGGSQLDKERNYTTHVRQLQKNDNLFMFSDGYADQFGGEKGKKFMVKRFHDTLLSIYKLSTKQQQQEIENQFYLWKGELEQVDDVLVIGIKIS